MRSALCAFEFDDLGEQLVALGRLLGTVGSRASAEGQMRAFGILAVKRRQLAFDLLQHGDHGLLWRPAVASKAVVSPRSTISCCRRPTSHSCTSTSCLRRIRSARSVGGAVWAVDVVQSIRRRLPLTHVVQQHPPFFAAERGGGGEVGIARHLFERELSLLDRTVRRSRRGRAAASSWRFAQRFPARTVRSDTATRRFDRPRSLPGNGPGRTGMRLRACSNCGAWRA